MQPDGYDAGSSRDWLRYARSDLALASLSPSAEIMLETFCFHSQQAAEKAIKAVLIACDISFPKVHNITALLDRLPEEVTLTESVESAASLNDYAVVTRYPGDFEPVDDTEYLKSLKIAEDVVSWAESTISKLEKRE